MNRSQSLLARIAVAALALLVSARALADVTLSVVDATPTAFHDGTLPGIGETIFSADVFVDVTPDDRWFSGGLGLVPGSLEPGVTLYYSRDPNTGDVRLTAPGNENDAEAFGTFVSVPFGQSEDARFRVAARVDGGYWGAPNPMAEPTILEATYWEFPPSLTFGSGFTERVTIDTSESAYADWDVYVSSVGPRGLPDVLLGEFESLETVTPSAQAVTLRWGFYAVPEPASLPFLCLGIAALSRRTRFGAPCGGRALMLILLVTGFAPMKPLRAQSALVGAQVRVDESANRGVSELAIASTDTVPHEMVSVWHDYTTVEATTQNLGVGISVDGGRSWVRDVLPRGIDNLGCSRAIDPFAFSDDRTGRLWVGALGVSCTGTQQLFVARKEPGQAELRPAVVVWEENQSEVAFGAAGPDPADPSSTDPNSVFLYVVHFNGFSRSYGRGNAWADPRNANDITLLGQPGGHALVPGGGGEARVRAGPNGELFIAWTNDDEYRLLVDEDDAGVSFDEAPDWNENEPANPDGFSYLIANPSTKMGTAKQDWIPGTLRMPNFPHLAVGPADPNDPDEYTLYFMYHDWDPNDVPSPPVPNQKDIDIYLTKSTDHGRTWDTPVQILEDPVSGRSDQFLPFIEVTSEGILHVTFYDTRESPNQADGGADGLIDAYYAYSEDDGDTWTVKRLTQTSFSVAASEQFLGDYGALAAVRGPASAPQTIAYPCYVSSQAGDRNVYMHRIDHNPPPVTPGCSKIDLGSGRSYALALNGEAPGSGTDFTWDPNAATLTLLTAGDWQVFARDNPSDPNSCAEPNMAERGDISHRITIDPDIAGYTSLHLVARDILALTGGGDTLSFDTSEPNDPVGLRLNVRDIYGGVAGNHLRFDDAIGVLGDQGVNTIGAVAAGVVIDVERIGIGTRLELASLAGDLVCGAAEARGANPSGGGIEAGLAVLGDLTGAISIADDFPGRIEIGGDVDQGQIDIAGDMRGAIDIAGYCDGDITILGDMLSVARIHIGGQLKLGRTIAVDNLNLASEANQGALIEVCKHLVGTITAAAVRGRIEIGKSIGTDGTLAVGRVTPAGSVLVGAHLRGLMDVDDGSPGSGLADLAGVLEVRQDVREGGRLYVKDCLRSQARIFGSLLDNGGAPNPAEIAFGAIEAGGAITIDYDGNHDATGCEQAWGSNATIVVGTEIYDGSDYASDPSMRIELAELHVYDVSNLPGDCNNDWALDPNDLVAFDAYDVSGTYETDYPGLGGPDDGSGNPFGSFKFHFDVNCDGVIGDPNDLTRLTALTGQNPPADCRNALPGCAAAADDCPLPPQAPIPPAPL